MIKQIRLFYFLALYSLIFPKLTLAKVVISEVYPNPNNEELEWVELFNQSDQDIYLKDWQLWDELSKPSLIKQFTDETITANHYLVIELKSVLNNSGDSVILYNDQQEIQNSLTYSDSEKGLSWSRNLVTNELINTNPSPNEANLFPSPTVLPTTTPSPTDRPTTSSNQSTQTNNYKEMTITPTKSINKIQKKPYPVKIIQPTINLPKQEFQSLQTIFFEAPQLEHGAIDVIIGGLLLLIPGVVYAKKKELL